MANKKTGLIKLKKSPKIVQSLGLVQFQVPSPQRVKEYNSYQWGKNEMIK